MRNKKGEAESSSTEKEKKEKKEEKEERRRRRREEEEEGRLSREPFQPKSFVPESLVLR